MYANINDIITFNNVVLFKKLNLIENINEKHHIYNILFKLY